MTSLPGADAESLQRRALTAAGFTDLDRARSLMGQREFEGVDLEALVAALSHAPDPEQALLLWLRLIEREPDAKGIVADEEQAARLARLLGASEALGEFLIRRPEHLDLVSDPERAAATAPALTQRDPAATGQDWQDESAALRRLLLESVGADPEAERPVAGRTGAEAAVALRRAYRRQITAIALQDLGSADPTLIEPSVSAWLADLAGAAIDAALAVARDAAVERHGEAAATLDLAVIGMGKCGARELNYISDVDVVFVHAAGEGQDETTAAVVAAEMAGGIGKVVYGAAPEPNLWEVDANLRPEGRDGALSRTVDSHAQYYRRWAHGWEFQALLKARPIAGSTALGAQYMDRMWPLVWKSSAQEGFVESVQKMRGRVMDTIAHADRDREIKLGSGGLRDVEFTAQLLQLVHGRADETVRVRSTLEAIDRLCEASYISTRDAEAFAARYRWLRTLEHRIQLVHLRRTHLMPTKEEALRVVARSMQAPGEQRHAGGGELSEAFRTVRREVRQLHERIFYRPLLSTTAALSDDEVKLTAEAVQERLAALGYRDPKGALGHIESLTRGVSRRAAMQRQLLPVMLGWFADGPDPDGGLLAFRRLSESLGASSWFLRMLRDSNAAAQRLCGVLSSSRFIGDLLEHSPESTAWLGDDRQLEPMEPEALWKQARAVLSRRDRSEEPAKVVRHVRHARRREILRVALADASGHIDLEQTVRALSDVDHVAVLGALHVCLAAVEQEEELLTDVAVVAMGRQGGREITYGSDLDAMFVHRPREGADPEAAQHQAVAIAKQLTALLKQPAKPALPGEPALVVDADLRPEGRQGPLVRSMDSYREYYQRWAEVWERQALLRARPLAGEPSLLEEIGDWADSVRYSGGLSAGELREIRRIKARVESERLPRGVQPSRHVKLGPGGLSDVEWLVQTLQLRHAGEHSSLRTTSTLPALRALVSLDLLPAADAEALEKAWLLCSRIRAAGYLWSGKASDVLPSHTRDVAALARWCAGPGHHAGDVEEHVKRTMRHARQVFEKHFYGL
ncbi:bifunctional [glutamine synthetase] adenylyltransferase/[glutamine synthetase]-adenylyl-L-tyrosine phosphorylase [Micrococcus sp. FDAARGOS_333]|uniref:bifunctional [glutamine synthetase] adenylyltransferase/[glutamine synthetase]-adenylyl-L-tyrosine phosphorylase n=1 Tax=Micrococcus sp. FDAARGOS_333 TaxID=1930558 RepID=UPI000B4E6B22|nr:bifunctional [glutamine synthetase] adenylyltransferase/[glutamine synthetase]-adenylyl-L-tyrosine phosphorylase [Micrococcus sp. FDAARGOS_333]PNL18161.1 bifunctional glutamine-synthetase adenylyltransferase/deadenyltransferase [Micrococcus sp. FDAARGOS_333]